jgi:outer membrane receptor protein involved in Fe transport
MYTLQAQRLILLDDPAIVLPGDPLGRTPGTSLTPLDPGVKETIGGNPHLNAEVAYEWTYGAVWTPAKLIKGLTLSADWYHIDLRNTTDDLDPNFFVPLNFDTRKTTLPNGAPTGGAFSEFIQRDPITGTILTVNANPQNVSRVITEGLDYEAVYQLDSSTFGRGNFGTLTFTFNGNYLARFVRQPPGPGGPRVNFNGAIFGTRFGSYPRDHWYASVFYDGPSGSWLAGLDAGAVVHYVAQYNDGEVAFTIDRKIREWTTLDLIVNYTFNLPQPTAQTDVAGYAKDGANSVKMNDDKDKKVMPLSTAEYNPCGWRAWLHNTTITLGVNNVFDQDPPFAAGAANFENNYDERQANIRGRIWYMALRKRF